MPQTKALDALRAINQALADGEARIKKQQEIIADHHLLSWARADCPTLPPPRFGAWLEVGRDPVSGLMAAIPLVLSFFSSIAASPTSGFDPP
jgi:hypothetical protein